eukprot:6172263-Pleurochrysis_carterae.AAC.1
MTEAGERTEVLYWYQLINRDCTVLSDEDDLRSSLAISPVSRCQLYHIPQCLHSRAYSRTSLIGRVINQKSAGAIASLDLTSHIATDKYMLSARSGACGITSNGMPS